MSPASRVAGATLSPIRRMALGAPPGTISLGLGEPGWPLPRVARDALARVAQDDGPLPYGPNTASPDLVEAVAAFHAAHLGAGPHPPTPRSSTGRSLVPDRTVGAARPDGRSCQTGRSVVPRAEEVMVTAGSQAALFALFQAWVEPGSTVLVPDPGFVSYAALARSCGAEPVGYPLTRDGDLDAQALARTLAGARHTSLVVLNHPANPTGGMASAHALRQVAEVCRRAEALLVSDEVYRELWVAQRPPSLHEAAGPEGGVVLGSVSKAFGAPGLRVGWAVGPATVLEPARIVHNAMTTAVARPSQEAALALLTAGEGVLEEGRDQVRERWAAAARLAPELLRAAGAQESSPLASRAGFYLWLPVPGGVDPRQTTSFALRVRDESRVTTVPGDAFGPRGAGFLRVSLGGPLDEVEEGLRRLAPWWKA